MFPKGSIAAFAGLLLAVSSSYGQTLPKADTSTILVAVDGLTCGAGGSSATSAVSPSEIDTLIPSLRDSARGATSSVDQPTMARTLPWSAQDRMSALRGIPQKLA